MVNVSDHGGDVQAAIDAAAGLDDRPPPDGVRLTPRSQIVAGGTTRHNAGQRYGG